MTSFIVWVGGIDDHYETEAEAVQAAEEWRSKGYDDVLIESVHSLETVTCSECGRVGSEAAALFVGYAPLCHVCFHSPSPTDGITA